MRNITNKLNLLVLTYWRKDYMSHRQNIGTLERLNKYCNINIYSKKDIEDYIKNISLSESIDKYFDELIEEYNPDIFICYGAMGFTDWGSPFRNIKGCKVCIEPDYHNFFGKEVWYRNNKFDYMFLRNANNTKKIGIPSIWWPWSADEKEFYPKNGQRRNIIGFAGSSVHELYKIRKRAIDILSKHGLLENKKKTIMASEMSDGMWKGIWNDQGKYQEYLRSIVAILASTENRGPFAKTFEAMASNTAVLSSPVINKELLFGNKKCYFEYKEDCSDIVKVTKDILNNPSWVKEVVENARNMFLKFHTTEKRVKELHDNFVKIIEGKEPERKWGI